MEQKRKDPAKDNKRSDDENTEKRDTGLTDPLYLEKQLKDQIKCVFKDCPSSTNICKLLCNGYCKVRLLLKLHSMDVIGCLYSG